MQAPPAGRGRHMVLPAWMTRGPHATTSTSAGPSLTSPGNPEVSGILPGSARTPVITSSPPEVPAVSTHIATIGVANGVRAGNASAAASNATGSSTVGSGGPLGKWLKERSPSPTRRRRSPDRARRGRDAERGASKGRCKSDSRGRRDENSRRRSRSHRRSRSQRRSDRHNGAWGARDHKRDLSEEGRRRKRSPSREDTRRRSSSRRGPCANECISASVLADRLVEARQLPSRKRKNNEDIFLSWLCPKDFYSEDRQGTAAGREEFVECLLSFNHSVRVTKRLIAEEHKDHSFCMDFEEIKGGKNQVNLYECRKSKLVRVYSFRDSDDLTTEKLLLDELKKTRIFQKAWKYFCKKGVSENAKLIYHDYLNDPEVVIG